MTLFDVLRFGQQGRQLYRSVRTRPNCVQKWELCGGDKELRPRAEAVPSALYALVLSEFVLGHVSASQNRIARRLLDETAHNTNVVVHPAYHRW
jgi:hypothetical protein